MKILNIFAGENLSSLLGDIVLIGTNIATFVAWRSEKKKRKYDDVRAKESIVDELSKKNDECMHEILSMRQEMNNLKLDLEAQKRKSAKQDERILELESENKTLRENQQKLIRENEQLKYKLETLQYAGKKKKPVPQRKDAPCSN